jgi:hypothetical protein
MRFSFVHTALSRRVVAGIAWASVRAARDNDAFRNLGRWDRSNCVNCGRCHARRAPVQGYDTRARPFTRYEGRLRAPGQKKTIEARATAGFELCGVSWLGQPRSLKLPLYTHVRKHVRESRCTGTPHANTQ